MLCEGCWLILNSMHYFIKWITLVTRELLNDHTLPEYTQACHRINNAYDKERMKNNKTMHIAHDMTHLLGEMKNLWHLLKVICDMNSSNWSNKEWKNDEEERR